MKQHIKQGWLLAIKHFYIIVLLFLYQLLWGFFLYRFVESVVTPLLKRYPDTLPSETAVQLFLMEAQFQLLKTDLIRPYLWLLGGLFAARMLLTPLINAGLYYSLRHTQGKEGTRFLQGIRQAWRPVMLLYWLESLLILAPAWWLLPRAMNWLLSSNSAPAELLTRALPVALIWLLWAGLIHLIFLSMQFGAVSQTGVMAGMWRSLRHILPLAGISLIMWGIAVGAGLAASSISLLWAGLLALILHQAYYLVRTLLKVWTVAAQYDVWRSKEIQP